MRELACKPEARLAREGEEGGLLVRLALLPRKHARRSVGRAPAQSREQRLVHLAIVDEVRADDEIESAAQLVALVACVDLGSGGGVRAHRRGSLLLPVERHHRHA